ncbi:MAG: hypothetical protein ACREDO_01600 [Methyloceanibacter sp.]
MYAARPLIQETADRGLGKDFDKYFTQTLLPDYVEETGVDWNVVYDARGHFAEPHTEETVPLGTLQVRDCLGRVGEHEVPELEFDIREEHHPTRGPKNRYGAILFIEKEGFLPLFKAVSLAERYDLAVMSTKGMSVTAARYRYSSRLKVIDLGLRLNDIAGLQQRASTSTRGQRKTCVRMARPRRKSPTFCRAVVSSLTLWRPISLSHSSSASCKSTASPK